MITIEFESRRVTLDGRVAELICALVELADEIERTDKVVIVFDCAGKSTTVKITQCYQRNVGQSDKGRARGVQDAR